MKKIRQAAPLLLLLLAGCDNDKPVYGPPSQAQTTPATDSAPDASAPDASAPDASAPDASAPDASAPGPSVPQPATDPLVGNADAGQSADPFLASDPLDDSDQTYKPGHHQLFLNGHLIKGPTNHTHWLRGWVRSASVTVLLNSVRQGNYSGLVDKDISLRLREGLNVVTFVYQPSDATSSAQIEILESEHDPPIAPLVVFQSPTAADDGKEQALTKTFRFIAN